MKYFDLKENKQHGTFDFPIEFYHVTPSHIRYNMPYHWHTECEIIRILSGELSLIINDEKILAKKDDIIFVNSGMLHSGTPSNCTYECIVFDIDLLLKKNTVCYKQINNLLSQNKVILTFLPTNNKDLKINCDNLFEAIKTKAIGYEFLTIGSLYYLIGVILKCDLYINNLSFNKVTEEKIIQFKKVLSLIESKYFNTITLEDLSRSCNMSPKYFCKFFYEMTNKTPIEYLNFYRVEIACEQLLTTNDSITNISLNSGFNDVSYFIKTFKKYKGITPKQYLKQVSYNYVYS